MGIYSELFNVLVNKTFGWDFECGVILCFNLV